MFARARTSRMRKFVPLLVLTMVAATVAITPALVANAAACSKTYSVAISNQNPDPWPAGTDGSFTLSFTNTATNCTNVSIGSLKVTVPTGWTVTGASASGWNVVSSLPVSSGGTLDLAASSGTQKIATGHTLQVDIAASSACDGGSGGWNSQGWVATNFTNSQFATTDSPSISVAGGTGCHLEFIKQPASAEKNVHITSVAGHPEGDDVEVGAFSGSTLVASFTGNITLVIGTNPSGVAVLSPSSVSSTGVAAVGGVATFEDLSIDKSDEGYTLVASATGFSSATSDAFDIVDDFVDCATQSCLGSASSGGSSGQIDANGGGASFLSVSVLSATGFDCSGYQEVTGVISWKTDSNGDQIGTITAEDSLVKKLKPPDRGAAHFQVCFRLDPGKTPFLSRDGVNYITDTQPGLLPDCGGAITTNCVFARNKTGAGSAVVKFRVADGKGRI